ncbi:sensor histidine kinase [Nocardioides bigeumensis]|uniref:Histidine kinase/HSP90-like ATPase domain-containing protein n=1 Tax=Nocardioides bigeumensis TaxID=433657 RepID=A0ABN2XS20_9ACTN
MPETLRRVAIGARVFAILGLALPLALKPTDQGIIGLVVLVVAWAIASLDPVPRSVLRTVLEAGVVAACCMIALQGSPLLLGALVVVPFVAGLGRGLWGVSAAVSTQMLVAVGLSVSSGAVSEAQMLDAFSWMMTGVGLGLVASFVHSVMVVEDDPLASYREARSLIKELLDLSQNLSSGLDAVGLGAVILGEVRDVVPTVGLAVHVPHEGGLTTLVSEGEPVDDTTAMLAEEVVGNGRVRFQSRSFAFPLVADAELIAVVSGVLSEDFDPTGVGIVEAVYRLPEQLVSTSVRLDTALLFAALKHQATAEERGRWAREMHDGVAQDIAYLGYAVDALAAQATSDEQRTQLQDLRRRISGVVAEVRRSVLTLRTQVGASESLGAGLGRLARHLSDVSGIPIQVTVDERTTRLRPEVEAELLRIGQEAMNNAVKHARATQIDVSCRVDPPQVELLVVDNGRGLQGGRSDSHGLNIMKERARLIGAELEVRDGDDGGAMVRVQIGASTTPSERAGTPSAPSSVTMEAP